MKKRPAYLSRWSVVASASAIVIASLITAGGAVLAAEVGVGTSCSVELASK